MMKSRNIFSVKEGEVIGRLLKAGLLAFFLVSAVLSIRERYSQEEAGDEHFYVLEVERLQRDGLTASLTEGTSALFVSLGAVMSHITGDILTGNRIISLLSLILVLHAFTGVLSLLKVSREPKWLMVLTILAFAFDPGRSPFLFGINDTLMFGVVAQAIHHTTRFIIRNKQKDLIIAAIFLGAGFWIREITLLYVAAFGIASVLYVFMLHKKEILKRFANTALFFVIVALFGIIPHLPALMSNGDLGFEDKNYMGNWREREYLTQIKRIPSGSVFAYKWVDWGEVKEHKEQGLQPKLPETRPELWKLDPKMALDSFASNIMIRCTYLFSLRNGMLFILFLASFRMWRDIRKRRHTATWVFLATMILAYTLLISVITLHRIEIRWLSLAIMLMAAAGAYILDILGKKVSRFYKPLVIAQFVFICLSLIRNVVI